MSRSLLVAVLAGSLALAPSCSAPDDMATGSFSVVDSSGITIITNDLSRAQGTCSLDSIPRFRVGDRPGDPAHELYRVFGGTLLSDGRLAIVHQGSQELMFFSAEGDFLSASGGEGEGPGEFQSAFLLWKMPGDTLWVGDYRPWEFEVFAPNGTWVRAVRPEPRYGNSPRAFAILADGRAVLGNVDPLDRQQDFQVQPIYLVLHDQSGNLVDTLLAVPNGRWGKTVKEPNAPWLFPWFESFAEVTAFGDRLLVGHGSVPELRFLRVGAETEIERILRWTGLDQAVTETDVQAARAEIEEQYAELDANMRRLMVEPLIHADRPAADQMPAFINVMVGTDESIWIKEYPRPGANDVAEWIRFDRDGRFVCSLPIPGGLEVYEFGSDYVLGNEEGDLGVETVAAYDIRQEN